MDPDSLAASTTNAPRKEASLKGKPKVERKAGPTQVAFGYGGSSNSLRSYGVKKNINRIPGSSSDGKCIVIIVLLFYYQKIRTALLLISIDLQVVLIKELRKNIRNHGIITLLSHNTPLRRPYSGNPELLDEEEFAEDPQSSTYDEPAANSALELGLLDENMEETIFFLQLPSILPTIKQSTNAEVPEADKNANPGKGAEASQKPCKLEDLPAGLMGKMLVYRSGAIKLKLGDTLYDVSAGLNCVFGQDVVAINPEDKHCCNMGEINKRAIITPDTDSMLDAIADL
ncbi:hypothetical protein Sango_1522500 [Sesamum angolense]|uniref:DNA-directed RNA polymerase III subunit RPC4 n=1 Tax=Sesamum angolense TaxID=2727404 RepID=A0AAE2BT58_9LAMI|nr:hypothetical protein Sango_1522500 [Sesamum angolense]